MSQSSFNAFTAPASIRWARHEQAQISRNTGPVAKSICIAPAHGSLAERRARGALLESRQEAVDKFIRGRGKR